MIKKIKINKIKINKLKIYKKIMKIFKNYKNQLRVRLKAKQLHTICLVI